ncbi:tetratricopeptide repeat protein 16 [Mixophyes fleayi]|uniref:tetratricopeptide repeat protein 16 n=1 Tax=Mixophyes fleayi TaxID=3061075 RepID=UPI003F4D8224
MAEGVTEMHTSVPEEMTENLFPTAVSEEQLQEAQKKFQKRIFGSSQVFLELDSKPHWRSTFEDIVQEKLTVHYERGLQYLSQEEWEKAVISFSKAINLCPEKIQLYVRRAEAYLQLCDFQSAALNLRKACSVAHPLEEHVELLAFTYYLQGQSLFDQMCHLEALESFTRATEIQPQNRHYHMRSICCLAALGRYADCIRLINKRLEEEQGNPELYIVRARLYDQLNKATLSYYDVQKALSLDPEHREALGIKYKLTAKAEEAKAKAVNYAVQGQLQDALKKICFALENNPSSAEYHIFRGTVYMRLKDFSAAVDDFVQAMQLCHVENQGMQLYTEAESQLLLTYNNFAVHCYKNGFYQEGVLLLNKALMGQKNKKELYINRGDCLFQLGELAFALADYQQAFELDEGDWGIRTRGAKLLAEMGLQAQQLRQYQQAERHFSEAIRKHPLLPQLYLYRARLRRSLQNNMEAQEDAVISILLNPKSEEAAPTMLNFFSGTSLEEIINSKLASNARRVLEKSLKDIPIQWKDSIQSMCEQADGTTLGTKRDMAICMTDQQLAKIGDRQRQLKTEVRAALNRRGRLQSTAPHLTRPTLPQERIPTNKASHHWKTFGLGLTNPG